MTALRRADKSFESGARLAPGRPRSAEADRAIMDATVALLSEVGIEQTTVSAVIARSGVARATVYRRWPNREALIDAALSQVKGRPPIQTSGDIEKDLARAGEQTRAVFAEPAFQAFLPILVRDLLRDRSAQGVSDTYDRVAPNLRFLAQEYVHLAASAGLRPKIDPIVIGDILVGSVLMHLLSTGRPATRATVTEIVDVLLNGLKRRDGAASD
jgi:AcrR family transcriptional regulator